MREREKVDRFFENFTIQFIDAWLGRYRSVVSLSGRRNSADFDGCMICLLKNVRIEPVLMHFDSRIDLWCKFAVPWTNRAAAGENGLLVLGSVGIM